MKTIAATLQDLGGAFRDAGLDEARLKAALVIEEVTGLHRLQWHGTSRHLTADELVRIDGMKARMLQGEPIQYVFGATNFLGRLFVSDRRALVPRPETEELVEQVLGARKVWARTAPVVVDIGTGTGCIIITIAAEKRAAKCFALDTSADALSLAHENAKRLGVEQRITFVQADALTGWNHGPIDLIVSNPPYIATHELAGLPREIREHEPVSALDGGVSGLVIVERILQQAFPLLADGGSLFMEIGSDQGKSAPEAAARAGFRHVEVLKDLAKNDRMLVCEKS